MSKIVSRGNHSVDDAKNVNRQLGKQVHNFQREKGETLGKRLLGISVLANRKTSRKLSWHDELPLTLHSFVLKTTSISITLKLRAKYSYDPCEILG